MADRRDLPLRYVLGAGAITFIWNAAFPRLAYRLRWRSRLGPRGVIAYIAVNTLVAFVIYARVVPYFKRVAAEHERVKAELRERLGREPTAEELLTHLGVAP